MKKKRRTLDRKLALEVPSSDLSKITGSDGPTGTFYKSGVPEKFDGCDPDEV